MVQLCHTLYTAVHYIHILVVGNYLPIHTSYTTLHYEANMFTLVQTSLALSNFKLYLLLLLNACLLTLFFLRHFVPTKQ